MWSIQEDESQNVIDLDNKEEVSNSSTNHPILQD